MDEKTPDAFQREYYPSGNVKSIQPVHNGIPHGAYEEFYSSGAMKCRRYFDLGNQYGLEQEWDEKGRQTMNRVISLTYDLHDFHKNGKLKSKIGFRDGRYHGTYETFYDNGEREFLRHYMDGDFVGTQTEYYTNGKISRETIYPESLSAFSRTPGDLYIIKSYDANQNLIFKSTAVFLEADARQNPTLFFDIIPKTCPLFFKELCELSSFFSRKHYF